jgi:hypothetical protein
MCKKVDLSENGKGGREPDGHIYPIRINPSTVFYVTKEKNTKEYREKLIERYNKNKYKTW